MTPRARPNWTPGRHLKGVPDPIPAAVQGLGIVWDDMGYHGIIWASMEPRRDPTLGLNLSLTTAGLKEWLSRPLSPRRPLPTPGNVPRDPRLPVTGRCHTAAGW